jgi:integrase
MRKKLGPSWAHAEAEANRLFQELAGLPPDVPALPAQAPGASTLQGVLDRYVRHLEVAHADKPATAQSARYSVTALLKKHDGRQPAKAFTTAQQEVFMAARKAEGISPHTIAKECRVLKAALRHAVAQGWIPKAPRIPMPKGASKRPKRVFLSEAQVEQLLAATKHPATRMLFALCWRAGLRRSEALFLQWSDVDLLFEELTVQAKPGFSPKDHETRIIPIGPRLLVELRAWKERSPIDEPWVFPSRHHSKHGNWTTPEKRIREAFEAAKLYKIKDLKPGLHALRRAWATYHRNNGTSDAAICEMGGWANVATFLSWYYGTSPEETRGAMDRLG